MSGRTPRRGTALARVIDIRYRSNRIALAGAAAVGVASGVVRLIGGELAFAAPFWAGVGAFVAWAVARELSPDHSGSAALAIAVAGAMLFFGPPFIGLNVLALLAVRMWAGTVGHHPSVIDMVAGLALAAYAGTDARSWAPALALGVGIVVFSRHRGEAAAAVAAMVAVAAGTALAVSPTVTVGVSAGEWAGLGAVAVAVAISLPIRSVRSTTDRRSRPLAPERIGAAWLVAVFVAAAAATTGSIADAGPVLAALVASAPPLAMARRRPSPGT